MSLGTQDGARAAGAARAIIQAHPAHLAHAAHPAAGRQGAGRPRDPKVDEAVLKATRELLADDGYRLLTVDAVAKRAKVSRTTIRLRWKSKAEMVFDAVCPDTSRLDIPDTGSLEGDLRECVRNAAGFFQSAGVGAAFQGLLDDCRHHPEIRGALLERVNAPTLDGYTQMIERARSRGEVGTGFSAEGLLDIVAGAVLYRMSVSVLGAGDLEDELVLLLSAGIRSTAGPTGRSASRPTSRPDDRRRRLRPL